MSYRVDTKEKAIVIDGFKDGIAASPYLGIANLQNVETAYYPGVAYVNYKRQASTITGPGWYAGSHSTNVSNNAGWIFADSSSAGTGFTNPVYEAQSPVGLNYVLDDSGQIWKQNSLNSSGFTYLSGGTGRVGQGAKGLAYWNNYLVVFGAGLIEFCGDGTGDSGVISTNWNKQATGFQFAGSTVPSQLTSLSYFSNFYVNDRVRFTTTGTLPSPLVAGTDYYVTSNSGGIMQVSTARGGLNETILSTGTGAHTITNFTSCLPIGNVTDLHFSAQISPDDSSATMTTYTTKTGTIVSWATWELPSGVYNILSGTTGNNILASFTRGSATVTFLSPIVSGDYDTYSVQLLYASATTYKTYVSKVDGNLYFANGRNLGRILSENTNTVFNPIFPETYVVNYSTTALLQPSDTIVDMVDMQSTLILAGNKDLYPWDYVSATPGASNPIGEQIVAIDNCLNNIYVLAGQKGNIFISNGFSSQLFYNIPDSISGVIDPVMKWGGLVVRRAKLYFQLLIQTSTGTNILAGIFSLIVSPANNDGTTASLQMNAQNSYGLTPASGALQTGVLMDNSPSSTGYSSFYSGWSNGATTGGIDYNDTTPWGNYEPTIETDIIPIGTILEKQTFGNIEFKLDRPMVAGDAIRIYWRPSLSDSYTLIGTTTTAQLSDYYTSNINQSQWAQFKVQMKCVASGSSCVPLREIRLHMN